MLLFVHGVRETAESLASSERTRRILFGKNINKRMRRRYPFAHLSWHQLSRRANFPLLLGHPVDAHLDAATGSTHDSSTYLKDLEARLECSSAPSASDFLDYVALLVATKPEFRFNDEAAEDALSKAISSIADGNHVDGLSSSAEIIKLAQELRIHEDAASPNDLDMRSTISGMVEAATALARNAGRRPLNELARDHLATIACNFASDSFSYLITRDLKTLENIKNHVAHEILETLSHGGREHPLILLGHSFGGVILYDLLNDEAFANALTAAMKSRRPPYQKIFLVTVGSQVALFHRAGFYAHQKGLAGATPTPMRPAVCEKWINIYDKKDYLGFSVLPFDGKSDGVIQLIYDTNSNPLAAHSAYLDSENFWARLGITLSGVLPH